MFEGDRRRLEPRRFPLLTNRRGFILAALFLAVTLAASGQAIPRTQNPLYKEPVPWAQAILFPPPSHMLAYCQAVILDFPSGMADAVLQAFLDGAHRVRWPSGVSFQTPMGLALEACVKGIRDSLFLMNLVPKLIVPGRASSKEELLSWKATLVLRGAGGVLYQRPHENMFPFFHPSRSGLEGSMVFEFWGGYVRGPLPGQQAVSAAQKATVIEFRVFRGGKEEVYRIEASKYPDLW